MVLNLALDFCFLKNKLKNTIHLPASKQLGSAVWVAGSGLWPWPLAIVALRLQQQLGTDERAMHHFRLAAIAMAMAMAIAHLTTAKAAKVLIVIVTDSEWYYGGLVTSD